MDYVIHFDVAALLLGIILVVFYTPKQSIPGAANRMYRVILVFEMMAAALDIFTVIQYRNVYSYSLTTLYITNILYLITSNFRPLILLMYAREFAVTDKTDTVKVWIFSSLPYLLLIVMTATTPLTKLVFYFDEQRTYSHGPLHIGLYVIASTYMIGVVGMLIRYRKAVGKRRLTAILSFMALVLTATGIQVVFSNVLLIHFCSSCAALVMYLELQSPESDKDSMTGLFNRESFITMISDTVRHEAPFAIISVLPDNSKSAATVLGMEAYGSYLKSVGDFLSREFMAPVYLLADDALVFSVADTEKIDRTIEKLMARFEYPWNVRGVELARKASCSIVKYPDIVADTEGVLDAVNDSVNQLRKMNSGTVLNVTEPPHSGKRLDELEKQKLILEQESREATLAKERAERSDREKSMFLANMSHEIRTPMNAIIGMTDMILREDINDRVRQNAIDIKGAGDTLLCIINDILDISKVESGKMELVNEEYSVRKLITDIVTLISTRIDRDKVEFIVRIDSEIPEMLVGDETRVRQIFVNILNNAAKFTNRGSVTLAVTGVRRDDDFLLKAYVEDTGCGIKEENMDKLFKSFERIQNPETRGVEGTGLGLPLCKRLLLMMKGDIEVTSEFGRGSKFSFEIPQRVNSFTSIRQTALDKKACVVIICDNLEQATDRRVRLLCEALDSMEIDYRGCCERNDVETALATRRVTHVFMYRGLYEKYRDDLKAAGDPEIVFFEEEDMDYGKIAKAAVLHEPIYSLNVFRLIEGVKNESGLGGKFKAPEAVILAVDDNMVNLKVIEGLLKCFDITVDMASSGQQAIDMAAAKNYQIIFMDHMMPEMDGVEAMQRIRKLSDYYKDAAIVALTANAVNGVRNMFIESGFSEYLSKPIDLNHLSRSLLRFLPMDVVRAENSDSNEAGTDVKGSVKNQASGIDISGINVTLGLDNCGNSPKKYREQLEIFLSNGRVQFVQMQKLMENSSYKSLRVELRSLRSMAGILGALDLAALAAEIESAVSNEDTHMVKERFGLLMSKYSKILDSIENYIAQSGELRENESTEKKSDGGLA